ncbi:MAG: (d)CMP kinase [Actinomycetota bacterium]|nr:(d)CMP kinase [Actinomycetota bacterium]MDA3035246.1 (d)CMP kinase [Actinomycetota bacterium]
MSARAFVVALDGPAGAGKSTVARAVAARLGVEYLDTGAMYRAVTFAVLRRGVSVTDTVEVARLATVIDLDISTTSVVVDGVDATAAIRGREVTDAVSAVAANQAVRTVLVDRQRAWVAARGGGVVEGRDIATVVFPDAALKLFVTASPRVRAERRVAETGGDVAEVEASIIERDRRDSTRDSSPLLLADDAIELDTSDLDIDEVVAEVVRLAEERRAQ